MITTKAKGMTIKDLKTIVSNLLPHLTAREKQVIESRFGLVDGKSKTLAHIGVELGVTRERVRQIECKALQKVKEYLSQKYNNQHEN